MPPPRAVPLLHLDPHLAVVNKPAHILVVPAPGRAEHTVLDAVREQHGLRMHAVHRLDEDTTGALVLARTVESKARLETLFREHAVERRYLVVLSRMPSPRSGRIESRLRENRHGIVESVASGGQRAITHYCTLHRLDRHTLVECRLETGRRNQIRVHMADLGCPVVGDRKHGYRGPSGQPLLLHSWRIGFAHPLDDARIEIEAPLPEFFPVIDRPD